MKTVQNQLRIVAGVCYCIWPLSFYLIMTAYKNDKFLRYHGYQALFFGICSTVGYLVIGTFLKFIPVIGQLVLNVLVILWILLVLRLGYRCLQGDYFRIPLIYDLVQDNWE